MNTDDIIKARAGLEFFANLVMERENVKLARESLAAFERLVADPVAAPPQMPMRAYIAAHVAGSMMVSKVAQDGLARHEDVSNLSVNLADALIERLKRK